MFGKRRKQAPAVPQGDSGDDSAPGWDAIGAAFATLYPGQEPKHWGSLAKLPGDPGLDGLSAYRAGDHWHFVTLGLSELWSKETDDPTRSGFGYEFTLRARGDSESEPPAWPLNLLQRLGDAVFGGRTFGPGHTLDPGGPITGNPDSSLTAMCFAEDTQLGTIDTPHGRVQFVQVVGITQQDLEAARGGSTGEVLARIAQHNPLLITDEPAK